MQKLAILFTILFIGFGLVSTSVEAKRFGGGSSIGKQRILHNHATNKPSPSAIPNKPQNGKNRWLGPLAGFAAGSLLASLFMGNGLGGILSLVLIIVGIFLLWRLLKNRPAAAKIKPMQYASGSPYNHSTAKINRTESTVMDSSESPLPNFSKALFLRNAKTLFIRLQAAYDNNNLTDIREFTTPEVFAEIRLQLQERTDLKNHTDVVTLQAELLEAITENNKHVASVKFSGLIRETEDAPAISFNETWHFQRSSGSGWLVAGIQQES